MTKMTKKKAIDRIKGWKESNQDFIDHPNVNQATRFTEKMLNYFRQNGEIYDMCIEALSQPEKKKGKWVFNETLGGWHCSECVATAPFLYMESLQHLSAYCPGCGAPMEVEK